MPQISWARHAHPTRRSAEHDLFLTSPSFGEGAPIPIRHTLEGEDLSPALVWSDGPPGTASFALTCEELDEPSGMHWVAWNIAAIKRHLPEGIAADAGGITQGLNRFGHIGYDGPASQPGAPRRYAFRVYALDIAPNLSRGATIAEFDDALEDHVLADGALVGTYEGSGAAT
jgi:Raf kinase inhibitor-like YbhB/YbcL family protein